MALLTPCLFASVICPAGPHLQSIEMDQVLKEGGQAWCCCLLELSPAFAGRCSIPYNTSICIVHSDSSCTPCVTASMECLANPHLRLVLACKHLTVDQVIFKCISQRMQPAPWRSAAWRLIVHFTPLAPSGCLYKMPCRLHLPWSVGAECCALMLGRLAFLRSQRPPVSKMQPISNFASLMSAT